ncbi:MAG: hypothetical protein KDA61_00180, partial [Planctomycetales bacterium]|nr:hypothetical protein [Planctomycetales bacterium]
MSKSTKGEQLTALASTIVAVIILAAGVTAHQTHSASRGRLFQKESDLRLQIDLGLSHNRAAMKERLREVDAVLDSWSRSQQTPEGARVLGEWLDEAINATMPGAVRALPPRPQFEAPPEPSSTEVKVAPTVDAGPASNVPVGSPAAQNNDIFDAVTEPRDPLPVGPAPTPADAPAQPELESARPLDREVAAPRDASTSLVKTVSNPQAVEPAREIQVNVAQLRKQAMRYRNSLVTFEVSLDNPLSPIDESTAVDLVERLARLAGEYDFLQLYYASLSANEKAAMPELPAPAQAARHLHKLLEQLAA